MTGSCLCGRVRYEIHGKLGPVIHCHCITCRKAQGGAFVTNAPVRAKYFRLVAGSDSVVEFESSPGKRRCFCRHCGSPVWSRRDSDPETIRVRLGLLDSDPARRPVAHIWVGEKAPWYEIADELPRSERGGEELEARGGAAMGDEKREFWRSHDSCWACGVLAGTASAAVVVDTPEVCVLVNPLPLGPGHTLVIPRQHIRNVYELPDHLTGPVLSTAARVARAAKRAFSADGVTLRQNNDAASDQHLFHFHLHVIPRFFGDTERFHATPQLIASSEQEATAAHLRAGLSEDEQGV